MSSPGKPPLLGAERERELLREAETYVYKQHGGHDLHVHVFSPKEPLLDAPAIAFFHGGLWDNGTATQFVPQCLHFSQRGMVAVTFEYRTAGKHGASPEDSVEDIQDALVTLKEFSQKLGFNPDRLIASGAGSGAYGALCAAMLPEIAQRGDFNARPAAIIGISSVVNTTRKGIGTDLFTDRKKAKTWSPSALVKPGLPPILLLHGLADRTAPFPLVAAFAKAMKKKGNVCDLIEFDGADHSFFNFNVSRTRFDLALASMDQFLINQGYLPPAREGYLINDTPLEQ